MKFSTKLGKIYTQINYNLAFDVKHTSISHDHSLISLCPLLIILIHHIYYYHLQ